ncbi:histidine phosphotransferase family protein [Litorisediminicola beolgyonensis]|uniref:Histidine phosphotransferase family protein n=1 Tax=Litorisediminicola beolgyonensis TaxID=1173614 RepID=A0ABW3ZEC0_9RHOB
MDSNAELAAMIGSRICHDLISPIGAINNGLELISMSGASHGCEMELISDSCKSATARIRFFRVAFGSASETQRIGRREILSIFDEAKGGRIKLDWRPEGDLPRTEVQLAFLAFLCFETAMPHGGAIRFDRTPSGWSISAQSDRMHVDRGVWTHLGDTPSDEAEINAARVQFALLPQLAAAYGRKVEASVGENAIAMRF